MRELISFFKKLEVNGYSLGTVFDIGACYGAWSSAFSNDFPSAELILFEANPVYADLLSHLKFRHYNVLLSNPEREFVDFYNGTNTGDSYYKETTKFYDHQSFIRLPCETLDAVIDRYNLPIPNFIKLDTQGSELDILSGFTKLDLVDFCYVECPIINYNKGAPQINDYLDYFRGNKFVPLDILEVHKMENILVQVDIIFAKDDIKNRYFGESDKIRPFA